MTGQALLWGALYALPLLVRSDFLLTILTVALLRGGLLVLRLTGNAIRTHNIGRRCCTSVDPVLDRLSQRQIKGGECSRCFCLLHILHRVVNQHL